MPQYRAELLKDKPRYVAVLKRWQKKPNGIAHWLKTEAEGYHSRSFGSIVAQVVEVTVSGGNVSVDRVVAVIDAGFAVSPDGMTAQIESGIMYGLSAHSMAKSALLMAQWLRAIFMIIKRCELPMLRY